MIKYRTSWRTEIEKIEVVRETAKFYVLMASNPRHPERREAKSSDWQNYFDTFKEAKQFLIDRLKTKIKKYELNIEYVEEELKEAEALEDK